MRFLTFLGEHRRDIFLAAFGAAVGGLFSFAVGQYQMARSFDLSLRRDIYYNLKRDVSVLQAVQDELDVNMQRLMNGEMEVRVSFVSQFAIRPSATTKNGDEIRGESDNARMVADESQVPIGFDNAAWVRFWLTEIDYTTMRDIETLYKKMAEANDALYRLRLLVDRNSDYTTLEGAKHMQRIAIEVEKQIEYVTQERIIRARQVVDSELKRLTEKLVDLDYP